jgi:hypothetical protein
MGNGKHKDIEIPENIDSKAIGRNGWFKPALINIDPFFSPEAKDILISVSSERMGKTPPVYLRIPKEIAVELADAIKEIANG